MKWCSVGVGSTNPKWTWCRRFLVPQVLADMDAAGHVAHCRTVLQDCSKNDHPQHHTPLKRALKGFAVKACRMSRWQDMALTAPW